MKTKLIKFNGVFLSALLLFCTVFAVFSGISASASDTLPEGLSLADVVTTNENLLTTFSLAVSEADGTKTITITAERSDTSMGGYTFSVDGEQVKGLGYGNSCTWTPAQAGTFELKTDRYSMQMSVVATLTAKLTIDESFFAEEETSEATANTAPITTEAVTDATTEATTASTSAATDPVESTPDETTASSATDPTEATTPAEPSADSVSISDTVTTDNNLLSSFGIAISEADGVKSIDITVERIDTSISGYAFYIDGETVKSVGYGTTLAWTPNAAGTYEIKVERYNMQMSVVATLTAKITVDETFFDKVVTDPTEATTATESVPAESTAATEPASTESTPVETEPTESTPATVPTESTQATESTEATEPSTSTATDDGTKPSEPESSTAIANPTSTAPTEPETSSTAPQPEYELGDVNKDGKLNIKDATLIQKYLAKIENLDSEAIVLADYDLNKKVNIKDATAIQKKLAKLL